jgi:hypothetical protein
MEAHFSSIVFVSGIGIGSWVSLFPGDSFWNDFLEDSDSNISLYEFEHGISIDNEFDLDLLLNEGNDLLTTLKTFLDNTMVFLLILSLKPLIDQRLARGRSAAYHPDLPQPRRFHPKEGMSLPFYD